MRGYALSPRLMEKVHDARDLCAHLMGLGRCSVLQVSDQWQHSRTAPKRRVVEQ